MGVSSLVFLLGLKAVDCFGLYMILLVLSNWGFSVGAGRHWLMANSFLTAILRPWCPQSLLMKIDAFHYVQLGTAYRSVLTLP